MTYSTPQPPELPQTDLHPVGTINVDQVNQKLLTLERQFHDWSGKVDSAILQVEKDVRLMSQLVLQTERKAYEVGQMHTEIDRICDTVSNAMSHLGGVEGLEQLQQEHLDLISTLETFQISHRQLQELQDEALRTETRIDDKLLQTQRHIEEVNQIVAVAKAELVRQAMTLNDRVKLGNASSPELLISNQTGVSDDQESIDQVQNEIANIRQEIRERHSVLNQMHNEVGEAIDHLQQMIADQTAYRISATPQSLIHDETEVAPDETEIEVGPGLEAIRSRSQGLSIPPPGTGSSSSASGNTAASATNRVADLGIVDQIRAEMYGLVQQFKTDKENLQREQKQKLKLLEQKLYSTRLILGGGIVLALVLAIVSIVLKFISF